MFVISGFLNSFFNFFFHPDYGCSNLQIDPISSWFGYTDTDRQLVSFSGVTTYQSNSVSALVVLTVLPFW